MILNENIQASNKEVCDGMKSPLSLIYTKLLL